MTETALNGVRTGSGMKLIVRDCCLLCGSPHRGGHLHNPVMFSPVGGLCSYQYSERKKSLQANLFDLAQQGLLCRTVDG